MNPRVDAFLRKTEKWHDEYVLLREISLSTGVDEDLKWGQPCYTLNGKNIFLLHSFKEYIAIFFIKGVLMKDPKEILIQQTPNVQSARQLRFKNTQEIIKSKKIIKEYIFDSIAVEEAGLEIPMQKPASVELPKDIASAMKKIAGLSIAFKKLTQSAQRKYILYFDGAKKEETRVARVEKYSTRILLGKRMNG
jgi:uncharacterized protein YdeI (YjbR/CyaY-like superfamily)